MKIKIDIDCTPQEARAFMGLPEVGPLQDAMMKELEKRLQEGFKTMDDMMAFALSANLVVNTKELDKLLAILKRALSDYEKFYKVFMDTLVEVGKV